MSNDRHSAGEKKAEVQGRTCPPNIGIKGRYMGPPKKGEKTHVKESFCFLSRAHTYLIASCGVSLPSDQVLCPDPDHPIGDIVCSSNMA